MSVSDSVLRAMTDDGAFRVIVARTTETVRGVLAAQSVKGELAERVGNLVTGSVLVRETMAPSFRVQTILQAEDGITRIVADSFPDGATRGLVQAKSARHADALGDRARLMVMRSLPRGQTQSGVVEVRSSGGISEALMTYMQTSEQVVSMISVATVFERGELRVAGGYIVQLLPELSEEMLAVMTARLEDFVSIDAFLRESDGAPQKLMDELLYRMPYTRLEESTIRYECRCSKERVLGAMATLPKSDIDELVGAGEPLEVRCDYCGAVVVLAPAELRGLLESS